MLCVCMCVSCVHVGMCVSMYVCGCNNLHYRFECIKCKSNVCTSHSLEVVKYSIYVKRMCMFARVYVCVCVREIKRDHWRERGERRRRERERKSACE